MRFHYGHPDVFERLFHITRGGISKASKGVNLSEDIFAGNKIMLFCCLLSLRFASNISISYLDDIQVSIPLYGLDL